LPIFAALAALLACALLSACGGSSKDPTASSEQQDETRLANFAKCLREHGVDAEAGSGPFGGRGVKVSPGKAGASPAAMEAAQKACARYRPTFKRVNLSPQQKVESEEAVRKFATCMRAHGIKLEASSSGGGAEIRIHSPGAGGPNPQSPGFQAAQNACQKLLPSKGGPGPGGATADGQGSGAALAPGG
jgi:hypothetical protein